jgi:hypothetical protein
VVGAGGVDVVVVEEVDEEVVVDELLADEARLLVKAERSLFPVDAAEAVVWLPHGALTRSRGITARRTPTSMGTALRANLPLVDRFGCRTRSHLVFSPTTSVQFPGATADPLSLWSCHMQ